MKQILISPDRKAGMGEDMEDSMKLSISGVCIDLTGEEEIEVSAEKCKKDGNYYLFFISSFYKRELTIWGGKHHMEQIINSLQKMLAEDKE